MQVVPYMIAAVFVGILISSQPPLNAILSRSVGSAYGATAISIFVAFACILVILVFTGAGNVSIETVTRVPWYVYMAGVVGAIFVASGPLIAPATGALIFFVCVVAGQLIGSTLADHFGAFGLEQRSVSLVRVGGIILVLFGAIMVSRG